MGKRGGFYLQRGFKIQKRGVIDAMFLMEDDCAK
jgi:hypothetical protein